MESYIDAIVAQLPASSDCLLQYRDAQHSDPTCSEVINYCKTKWPEQHAMKTILATLSLHNDLLLFRDHIVVPHTLRCRTMEKIHQGHQRITRCRLRVKSSVWWPGITNEIGSYVKQCPHCPQAREPLTTIIPLGKNWGRLI